MNKKHLDWLRAIHQLLQIQGLTPEDVMAYSVAKENHGVAEALNKDPEAVRDNNGDLWTAKIIIETLMDDCKDDFLKRIYTRAIEIAEAVAEQTKG